MNRDFSNTPPKVLFHHVNDQGGGSYRAMLPASIMRRNGFAIAQAQPRPLTPEAIKILDPDVVVFQLWQTEQQIEHISAYRKALGRKAFFVYDIDDLFWDIPENSIHRRINPLLANSKSQIRVAAKLCDAITVPTAKLADEMRKLTAHKDIRILPNEVTRSFVNSALAGRREARKASRPRVGWAGGIGHGGDLLILKDVMAALGNSVQWVFFGMVPPGIDPSTVEFHEGVPFADYAKKLGSLNLTVALAPLEDCAFNQCKSDLRVLEYAAAGFPILASNIGTYRDCPVSTCENTTQGWIDGIQDLLSATPKDRECYADTLHQWVLTTRCMDTHIAARVRATLPKNAEPFIPQAASHYIGSVVTVGTSVTGLPQFPSIEAAWKERPGADILYARPHTIVTESQAARLIDSLGMHASISAFTNDGMYPVFGKFAPLSLDTAMNIDTAAIMAAGEPINAPFPSGPCILLSGAALSRFGLPDTARFQTVEFALADWGTHCVEAGKTHALATNTFIYTDSGAQQVPDTAQWIMSHISIWVPGFPQFVQSFQSSEALTAAREKLELAYNSAFYTHAPVPDYPTWVRALDTVPKSVAKFCRSDADSWERQPKISVIMPVFNPNSDHFRAALSSVMDQFYENWELCIADDASTDIAVTDQIQALCLSDNRVRAMRRKENGHICKATNDALQLATGDWVVFLDHDDTLAPHALYMIAREIVHNPDAEFIYSDSDKLDLKGERADPYFLPGFSYELLLAQNYVTHLCAYKTEGVKAVGNMREGFEGSQDWDLVLRYLDTRCGTPPNDRDRIRHIPHVLYHWRQSLTSAAGSVMAKPYAIDAGRRAVVEHLAKTGQAAVVSPNPSVPIYNMVRFLVPEKAPKVTIIIPTKDDPQQLARCVSAIFANTAYSNFDILILNNGKANSLISSGVLNKPNVSTKSMPGDFNYSAFNNAAVASTDADFVCLLNDDTEPLVPNWLADMVGLAIRPGVGAVGAKLLYPDNTVQHAGIIFSHGQPPGCSALHLWQKLKANDAGQAGRACITQPVIAVTGACLLVRRETYLEVGGLDTKFPLDFNDVDFCLRLHERGYRNIIAAQSLVRHYEGQTKKRFNAATMETMIASEAELLARHWDVVDPFYNPNLAFSPYLFINSNPINPKPWETGLREKVLVVNGNEAITSALGSEGALAFSAFLSGHFLMFSQPEMPNVKAIDTREPIDAFLAQLGTLGITRVVFCGIGDGTVGAYGFFTNVANHGLQVAILPIRESKHSPGHISAATWEAEQGRFLKACRRSCGLEDAA